MSKVLVMLVLSLGLSGCTETEEARRRSHGKSKTNSVQCFSGEREIFKGKMKGDYTFYRSTVQFRDLKTGVLTTISGNCIIKFLEKGERR